MTNYSLFEWTIDSIVRPNAGQSGISYSGAPLIFCDVVSVYLDGGLLSWTLDFTVISACMVRNSFNVTARTSFSRGLLPGRYSPAGLGLVPMLANGTEHVQGPGGFDFPFVFYPFSLLLHTEDNSNIFSRLHSAVHDLGTRSYNALIFSNRSSPITLSVQAHFNYCPMSLGLNASCATNPPLFDIAAAAVVYPNSTIHFYNNQYPIDS